MTFHFDATAWTILLLLISENTSTCDSPGEEILPIYILMFPTITTFQSNSSTSQTALWSFTNTETATLCITIPHHSVCHFQTFQGVPQGVGGGCLGNSRPRNICNNLEKVFPVDASFYYFTMLLCCIQIFLFDSNVHEDSYFAGQYGDHFEGDIAQHPNKYVCQYSDRPTHIWTFD